MQISTTRFGTLSVDVDDLIHFPHGVVGFEDCRHWVLLADPDNNAVGWLQSAERPATALAVVSPRRFVDDYRIRVSHGPVDLPGPVRPRPTVRAVRGQQAGRQLRDEPARARAHQSRPPPGVPGHYGRRSAVADGAGEARGPVAKERLIQPLRPE